MTDLQALEKDALQEIEQIQSLSDIEALYVKYLGRKEGQLTKILRNLGSLTPEEKKQMGQAANKLKGLLEQKIASKKNSLQGASLNAQIDKEKIDPTLPGTRLQRGHSHPILEGIKEISDIFKQIGFNIVEGPEIETDKNNFTDLNIPENHPARDMHDTFYLKDSPLVLRTHTSPVQVRLMRDVKPPIRVIAPGRVYRHEAVDATHAAIFHQIEGLAVDEGITFADLKGTLTHFAQKYFGPKTEVRFRPSYFPFVEPGAEMDVQYIDKNGKKVWIEILGAGMVHPQVLRNVGYDPEKYTGFAFGMGVERLVMKRYGIKDIRSFLESDLRFLEQFK